MKTISFGLQILSQGQETKVRMYEKHLESQEVGLLSVFEYPGLSDIGSLQRKQNVSSAICVSGKFGTFNKYLFCSYFVLGPCSLWAQYEVFSFTFRLSIGYYSCLECPFFGISLLKTTTNCMITWGINFSLQVHICKNYILFL